MMTLLHMDQPLFTPLNYETKEIVKSNSLLECPVCKDTLNQATETICGHAFCEPCIKRSVQENGPTCPLCRNNPTPLHPSYTLRRLVEQVINPEESTEQSEEEDIKEIELANVATTQGQHLQAILHYNNVKSPTAFVYGSRAVCYFKLAQWELALADCEKSLSLDSANYVWVYICKALCLERLEEYAKSYATLMLARRLDSSKSFAVEISQGMHRVMKRIPEGSTPVKEQHNHQQLFFSVYYDNDAIYSQFFNQ